MYGVRRRQRSERYDTALLLPPTMLIMMLLFVGCRNKVDAWNVASPTLFHRQRLGVTGLHNRFTGRISSSSSSSSSTICLWASPSDTAGADIESQATLPLEPPAGANDEGDDIPVGIKSNVEAQSSSSSPLALRGKVNEIDYCIAPADVSLSRAYRSAGVNLNNVGSSSTNSNTDPNTVDDASLVGLSLTRALNNASNRAVRRILLSRSWPSAEALNQSLRKAVAAMDGGTSPSQSQSAPQSSSKTARTDAEYIADQLQSFAAAYGSLPGYAMRRLKHTWNASCRWPHRVSNHRNW
jgi:hypothetical protein